MNGKVFYTANFQNRSYTGDYVCYNDKSVVLAKGKIGPGGKMVGLWVIPREENGDCPRDKHAIANVVYTQKIKFDQNGNVDTNYMSKSYYLSGKLRDSVRVITLEYPSGYDYNGIWYLCGKNKNCKTYFKEIFDWEFYLASYEDLRKAGLKTEQDALKHYKDYGQFENRKIRFRKVCFDDNGNEITCK